MSCGKRSRPRNVTGLEAVEWYKEHRCEVSSDTDCYRWHPGFHGVVEYLKRRYSPDRVMLMLTGRDPALVLPEERRHVLRRNNCSFTDCINPSHLELHRVSEILAMVFEGHFQSTAERFTWDDGVNPLDVESERTTFALGPQDTENQNESSLPNIGPKSSSCTFGQLRLTIEGRHTWSHYNREYVPLPGFKALVRLRFDYRTLFECDGFENRQNAKAYCEALVTGDQEEVNRLEQVAVEDRAHRREDEYNWIDSVGYGLDDVEREAALTLVTAIEAGLEELARRHQLSKGSTRQRLWQGVIERTERLATEMLDVLPPTISEEVGPVIAPYGKGSSESEKVSDVDNGVVRRRLADGNILQNEAGGYRLADDLIHVEDVKWATSLLRHLNTVAMAVSENGPVVDNFSEMDTHEIDAALWIRSLLADSYGDELAVALMKVAYTWAWSNNDYIG